MNLRLKMMLLGTIPLIIVIGLISLMFFVQTRSLAANEIALIEQTLIDEKKSALKSHISLALAAIKLDYEQALTGDKTALKRIAETLTSMEYGDNGYFYVYDIYGTNIAHAKQPYRIGKNWISLQDVEGNLVIRDLIDAALNGGGFTHYIWERPSTLKPAPKISYNVELKGLDWVFGTGLYVDDVTEKTKSIRANVKDSVENSLLLTGLLAIISTVVIYFFTFTLNTRELGLADRRLQKLNERILTTQEEERSRVSKELHDGVSQLITATRFDIEHARKKLKMSEVDEKNISSLDGALSKLSGIGNEIRRISHDLRPRDLDELGLFAAIEASLAELNHCGDTIFEFEYKGDAERLPTPISNTLFRVFQEATTNIIKHARAQYVWIALEVDAKTVILTLADDGVGFNADTSQRDFEGIGIYNMRQRIESHQGRLDISSSEAGTILNMNIPMMTQFGRSKLIMNKEIA
ncbi:MAG: cache domain-containing protein [Rhizobiales bacterium]|nr:cache domain-containing protein [Hyphomicrobiales bacterium]NRB14652.1 cache domain-containing protein [Hyphomicrobiales bacterium]